MQYSKSKQLLRRMLPGHGYRIVKKIYWSAAANGLRRLAGRLHAAVLAPRLRDARTLLLFIGYPRSGHSLVGSLLNAHPSIVVAHELHALWYLDQGFSTKELFALIWRRDRWFGRHGRQWTEFNYAVPGQWQGTCDRLEVIGDKKGDGVTDILHVYPGALESALRQFDGQIKIIHTVRNPYDNVATMARRTGDPLAACIERHRNRVALNNELIQRYGEDLILTVRHEDLIADAKKELQRMAKFLRIQVSSDYLEACGSIIYESPNRSRHNIQWSGEEREAVERIIERTSFLEGYRFEA